MMQLANLLRIAILTKKSDVLVDVNYWAVSSAHQRLTPAVHLMASA
jgi:hypothetical protein